MAYNYLDLTNKVLHRFNETPLTSSTFSTAPGLYEVVKDGVNEAIRKINQQAFLWPFNFAEQEDTLVAGQMRYNYQTTSKTVDFNTFRIKRNNTLGTETISLKRMDYEEYLNIHLDDEYNTTDEGIRTTPRNIIRTPNREYIVHPSPDKAYELVYEHYTLPIDLDLYSDVPSLPVAFRHIIQDGATVNMYAFQSDYENADRVSARFKSSIEEMRTIYINRYEDMRDTRIQQQSPYGSQVGRIN